MSAQEKTRFTRTGARVSALATILLGLSGMLGGEALAHDGRGHGHPRTRIGVFIGTPPLYAPWVVAPSPWYYPPPTYYSYPVVTVPAPQPPVYVEQAKPPATAQNQNYWYYCFNPAGYYPEVKECPGGWQKVAPQPSQ